ncbi:MAG: hypothetical protein AAFU57_18475, partial [Bacteroidota bacterium]
MNKLAHLLGLILFFSAIQFQAFGQKEFNKIFFPKNKDAQWLMNQWGKDGNVKTLKKFNTKFNGEEDPDDYEYTCASSEYVFYVRLYSEKGKDGTYRYDGLLLERGYNDLRPLTVAGSTSKAEVLKKLPNDKNVEVVYNGKDTIKVLYHPMKLYVDVSFFDENTPGIKAITVSGKGYGKYYEEEESKKLKGNARQMLAATDFRFKKTSISISANQVRLYDPKVKDTYQIINMLYEGSLKNGVPHGKGK